MALWLAFPIVVNSYSYLAATMHYPLCDSQLAALDQAAGFHWARWFGFVSAHRTLFTILKVAYSSLFAQAFTSVGIFALTRNTTRNRELLWISTLAGFQAVLISGFVPALGPMSTGGVPVWTATLLKIRDGTIRSVALTKESGIVAFPSIHTALALTLVYVHRPPCKTFIPFVAINATMLLATPFFGHHYLTDMIGGTAITAVAIVAYRIATTRAHEPGRLNNREEYVLPPDPTERRSRSVA